MRSCSTSKSYKTRGTMVQNAACFLLARIATSLEEIKRHKSHTCKHDGLEEQQTDTAASLKIKLFEVDKWHIWVDKVDITPQNLIAQFEWRQ